MKIVVLDGYTENPGDLSWDALRAFGEVTVYDRTAYTDAPIIAERIGEAEIAVVNKTPIRRATLDACPNLKFVAVLATGYNIVDCAYAKEKGVLVANVPAYGTAAVAQLSIALLLELCHHVGSHSDSVHAGKWSSSPDFCYWDHPLIELAGKTIGIIGFGRIGKAEGRIAAAMGMRVLAYSPHPNDEGRAIAEYGAMLLNTARGQLLCEQDVADALNSGKLGGAAMDVVCTEPIPASSPLLTAKNCIITPHIAWAPLACRQRIMDTTVQNVRAFLAGTPQNIVNM